MKEAEMKLLLLTLQNPKFVDDLMINIKSDYIIYPPASKIFDWIKEKYLNSENIGFVKCRMELNLPDSIMEFTDNLLKSDFESYIDMVKKNYIKRKINNVGEELKELSKNMDRSAQELKREAQERVFSELSFDDEQDTLFKLDEALEQSYEGLIKLDQEGQQGLDTGYPSISGKIGGLEPGHVTVIAAQTSMGKTALALNIAHNVMLENKKALIFTLEMTAKEVADRLLIMNALVDASHFQKKLEEYEMDNVDAAASRLVNKMAWIDEKKGLSAVEILAKAKKVHQKEGQLDLVIVDYLQMMAHPDGENFARAVGESCNHIKEMAGELKVPVILISQLNRKVDGRPKLKHLRDSGRIEEVADEVWFLYREEYENEAQQEEVKPRQPAELIMAKGRTKGIGYAPLIWYPKLQKFRDGYIEKTEGPIKFYEEVDESDHY